MPGRPPHPPTLAGGRKLTGSDLWLTSSRPAKGLLVQLSLFNYPWRILSMDGKRFSRNLICEGETHGFEPT